MPVGSVASSGTAVSSVMHIRTYGGDGRVYWLSKIVFHKSAFIYDAKQREATSAWVPSWPRLFLFFVIVLPERYKTVASRGVSFFGSFASHRSRILIL